MQGRTLLSAGDPDTAFSGDGVTTVAFGGSAISIYDTALQSDGKVLVAGGHIIDNQYRGSVARLNVDGSIDTTYGNNGVFTTPTFAFFTSIDIGSDGKTVLGTPDQISGNDAQIVRLHADGSGFDNTFGGGDGIADVGNRWYRTIITDVVVQRDNKVLAVGTYQGSTGDDYNVLVVRYNADGSPDTGFDGDGIVLRSLGDYAAANAVTVDYSGNPATNPYYGTVNISASRNDDARFWALRLRSNGAFDPAFDGDGVLAIPTQFGAGEQHSQAVVSLPGGKVLLGGYSSPTSGNATASRDFMLALVNPNGSLDTSFNGSGAVLKDFGGNRDEVHDLRLGYAGEILAGGIANGRLALAAYNTDGTPDSRFSGDGFLVTPLVFNDTNPTMGIDVTLDQIGPARRIVVAGENGQVGRYIDVGSVITISAADAVANEAGTDTARITVSRSKAINQVERVYLNYSGTAARQGTRPANPNYDFTASNISWGDGLTSFTYVDIPANQSSVDIVITGRQDTLVEGDEQGTLSVAANIVYDVGVPASATFVIRDDEAAGAPAVLGSGFQYETAHVATIQFNQNVQASLGASDFTVVGPGNTSVTHYASSYDSVTNTASFVFNGILPDGHYVVTALAAGIRNGVNQSMASNYAFSFFVLSGDANRDRIVDFNDLLTLAKNYNQVGKTFGGGNFDYSTDGSVDFNDLLLLAKNYDKAIAATIASVTPSDASASLTRHRSTLAADVVA